MPCLRTLTIGVTATALASGAFALSGVTSAAAAHRTPNAPASHAVTVSTKHTDLGTFLVGPNGHTLYLFEKDKGGTTSHCYKDCPSDWPPLITHGSPKADGKVKGRLLGTTKRKNGDKQVTYNGHPLYYFAGDNSKSDTNGEGIEEFGAEWYVVNPKGKKIDDD